jgi:hypothetical protein
MPRAYNRIHGPAILKRPRTVTTLRLSDLLEESDRVGVQREEE